MAYCIRYGDDAVKETIRETARKPVHAWIWLVLTACCIGAFFLISGEGSAMELLTPSDPALTSALGTFQESIRAGEGLKTALLYFCKEILSNAGVLPY